MCIKHDDLGKVKKIYRHLWKNRKATEEKKTFIGIKIIPFVIIVLRQLLFLINSLFFMWTFKFVQNFFYDYSTIFKKIIYVYTYMCVY